MTQPRRPFFKLLFTVLIGLWTLNFVASLFVDGRSLQRRFFPSVSAKSERASLQDQERAQAVFREFEELETRYVPYVAWARQPYRGSAVTVNEAGDRVHPGAPASPVGHVRFFGGSTMWGSGVDDANTIPACFQALHPDWAVENHGESGFVSRQALARLINLVGQAEPMDLVVFYDGCNDLYSLCREDVELTGHREQGKMARMLEKHSAAADALYGSTLEVARAIGQELGIGGDEPEVLCPDDPEHAARVARTLINNWRIAHRVAELGGARLHAFLQPTASIGGPSVDYMRNRKLGSRAACYLTVYPLVQELLRTEGEPWMHDLTDAFDLDEYLYIDTCHVNGRGNQIVAERMDALLGETLVRHGG